MAGGGNPNDPFERDDYYKKGKFKGKRIPTDRQRSIQILSGQERKDYGIDIKKGEVAFASFSDDGTFKIAIVDPNNLSPEPVFLVEEFSAAPTGSHDMWLLEMKPGYALKAVTQIRNQPKAEKVIDDFIFSVEGINPESKPFDLMVKGMKGDYTTAYRFTSKDEKLWTSIVLQDHPIHPVRVELTQQEMKNFFLRALAESHKAGATRIYNTICRNCTSEALRILDEVLLKSRGPGYRKRTLSRPVYQVFTKYAPLGLIERGVADMDDWKGQPTLNETCQSEIENIFKRKGLNPKKRKPPRR
jgi:hypothetical protein